MKKDIRLKIDWKEFESIHRASHDERCASECAEFFEIGFIHAVNQVQPTPPDDTNE